ncbi:hypothetical protein GALMADRAFT_96063 [Galerina marginata CBS 339.88]|uniref:Beta-lactamase-related domain-containing protein n=1 Tax=Galerina marginata (strain CBS 339.88) TaxID=685588 RepID=A0A067T2C3_GALM3|nr:hypothetical protein GALMADRAFT_96063 [Galerina marginata CBS 339.88]
MVHLSEKAKIALDELLSEATEKGRVPGASFAVATADDDLYFGAAGLKSFSEPSAGNVDDKSIFWICSMTKIVVTLALLQLIEEGKIDYETPVVDIIPEMANPVVIDDIMSETSGYKPAQKPILIKHLINHSSGLFYSQIGKVTPDDLGPAYTSIGYGGDHSVAQFFKLIRRGYPSVPLAFEPGTNWMYGWSCDIIGFVVERISGKSLQEFCKERIFEPLGMATTTFYLTPELRENLVQMTYRRKDGKLEKWTNQLGTIEQDPEKMHVLLGGIGLYSGLKDYLTLLRHLLLINSGLAKNPILTIDKVSSLFKPSIVPHGSTNIELFTGWKDVSFGVGLCLATEDWPGRRKRGSGFWYGWAGTYYFMDPVTGIAVVYGTQVAPTGDVEVIRLWENLERATYAGLEN